MTAVAVFGYAIEFLRHLDCGDAEFGGLGDQVGRVGGGVVGRTRRRAQDLLGELLDRLDDHLLVIVGSEVEVVGVRWRRQADGRFGPARHPAELSGGRTGGRENLFDAVLQTPVERGA